MSRVRRELRREPEDLSGTPYVPISAVEVMEFHEGPGGEGKPTQVHMALRIEGLPDLPLVMRFKSHETISHLIEALTVHRNNVWPGVPRTEA